MRVFAKAVSTLFDSARPLLKRAINSVDTSAPTCGADMTLHNEMEDSFNACLSDFTVLNQNKDPKVAGFSLPQVREYASLASLAYCGGQREHFSGLERKGHQVQCFGSSNEVSGLVVTKGLNVDIIYKGTNSMRNVATDLLAWPVSTKLLSQGMMHAGFYFGFKSSWEHLLSILNDHATKMNVAEGIRGLHFTVVGHSMGAALATVSALQLTKSCQCTDVKVCTFGSPRVLTTQAAEEYEAVLGNRTLRVAQNGLDPVTMVAMGSLGFKHVGHNLRLDLAISSSSSVVVPHTMSGYQGLLAHLPENLFYAHQYVGFRRWCGMLLRCCLRLAVDTCCPFLFATKL